MPSNYEHEKRKTRVSIRQLKKTRNSIYCKKSHGGGGGAGEIKNCSRSNDCGSSTR